jgi:fumarate reductase flavoprotein subunit
VRGTELILGGNGAVGGAKAASKTTNYTINAKAVVLATGGYDASEELKAQYAPVAVGDFPLSSKGNTGDGLLMGIAAGAATEFKYGAIGFQIVDRSLPNSGNNGTAMNSSLFVKPDGAFVALAGDYPINYTALKRAGGDSFFGIYDAAGADAARATIAMGFAYEGATAAELAAAAGMDAAKLADSLRQAGSLTTPPYFAVVVRPSTIGSMGGLKINTAAQVLSTGGSPIPGLYAAGEVANGGFYNQEYPASGSSNSLAITFGREAGKNAAIYVRR